MCGITVFKTSYIRQWKTEIPERQETKEVSPTVTLITDLKEFPGCTTARHCPEGAYRTKSGQSCESRETESSQDRLPEWNRITEQRDLRRPAKGPLPASGWAPTVCVYHYPRPPKNHQNEWDVLILSQEQDLVPPGRTENLRTHRPCGRVLNGLASVVENKCP